MNITTNCAKELRNAMLREDLDPSETACRFGIKGGGCSGFTYILQFCEPQAHAKHDLAFEVPDSLFARFLVDKKSHLYIKGTVIDWSYDLMDRGLKFDNPLAIKSCGCKTSFMIDVKAHSTQTKPSWM